MIVLPQLSREDARERVERMRAWAPSDVAAFVPERDVPVTYPPTGTRIDDEVLVGLRRSVLELATQYGFPAYANKTSEFDGHCARLLHQHLQLRPHAASDDHGWSYITCCWLLDVAVWRYGTAADEKRFLGDLNRNAFRRLWWRTEVFGSSVDLVAMGEDELVSIMERPTLAADRRLARAIAHEFLARVEQADVPKNRMFLMREASKRVLRLTPFVSVSALDESSIGGLVKLAFDDATASLTGEAAESARPQATDTARPAPSPLLSRVNHVARGAVGSASGAVPIEALRRAAIQIATTTGRVTNADLRDITDLASDEARAVLTALVNDGQLRRRGTKRGTHYVLPQEADRETEPTSEARPAPPTSDPRAKFIHEWKRLLRSAGHPD